MKKNYEDEIANLIDQEIVEHTVEEIKNCKMEYYKDIQIVKKELKVDYPYLNFK